jgi:hypothetical protein
MLTEFVHPILNGEQISVGMLFAFLVPLVMSAMIVYSLFFVFKFGFKSFFRKSQYYFVFSNQGVDMAGWKCDWKTMVWFGGKKPMNGNGVIPCWAAKGIDEDYEVTLQVPSIKPVSEKLFNTLCHEICKRFCDEIIHLNELSWEILQHDEDLPFRYGKHVLSIPQKNQVLGECDIFDSD